MTQMMDKQWPSLVPFFVADRPMSLHIIKGFALQAYPGVSIGIMANANTSSNFQTAFAEYPCDNLSCCAANQNQPCPFQTSLERHHCDKRRYILNHTVKMCDSGIFGKDGAMLNYEELFQTYERMNVQFGIMIDVFRDSKATIESAKNALIAYQPYQTKKCRFELVAVAQGNDIEEYIDCYKQLKKLGFKYIAIGGLLRRQNETVRLTMVRDETLLLDTLSQLRAIYPNDWLFALGCLNPSRLTEFQSLNVWADYKGWIFQYHKKDATLNKLLAQLPSHIELFDNPKNAQLIETINLQLENRKKIATDLHIFTQDIYREKRELRAQLNLIYNKLQVQIPDTALYFKSFITRTLFSTSEEKKVIQICSQLSELTNDVLPQLIEKINLNRELDTKKLQVENQLAQTNNLLAQQIRKLLLKDQSIPHQTQQILNAVQDVIDLTENAHRLKQVRHNIAEKILKPLYLMQHR